MSIDFYRITGYTQSGPFGQVTNGEEIDGTNFANDIWYQILDTIGAVWPQTRELWPVADRAVGDVTPEMCPRLAFVLDRIIRIAKTNVGDPPIKITGGDGFATVIDMSARENGFANLSETRVAKLETIRDALRTPGLGFYWA